jgi:hypothetical protein
MACLLPHFSLTAIWRGSVSSKIWGVKKARRFKSKKLKERRFFAWP